MVPIEDKQKFLDELENLPMVSVVCRRVGIAKATIYRWRDEDSDFKKKFDRALKVGREGLTDNVESHLVKLALKDHFGAIRMILEAHSKRYYKPRKPIVAPQTMAPIQTVELRVVDANITAEDRERLRRESEQRNAERARARLDPDLSPWKDMPS